MERSTIQRKVILDGIETLCHATVDEIFELCKQTIPSLSFSTVYRNLVVLEQEHFIRRIPNKFSKDVYETTKKPLHDHFICMKCGKLVDYDSDKKHRKVYDKFGNLIYETTKISYGVCKECLENEALNLGGNVDEKV